jgi:hypothetical protein
MRHQDQVAGRADGQELGDTLDDSQDDDLQPGQVAISPEVLGL